MTRRIEVDTSTFVRFWLVILGLGMIAFFIWKALAGIIIVGISIFLAIAIRPLAKKLDQIDKKKKRPVLTTTIAYLIIVLGFGFAFAVIGPVIVNETANFVSQLPHIVENNSDLIDGMNNFARNFGINNFSAQVQSGIESFSHAFVGNFGTTFVSSISVVANLATSIILVLVLTYLFLLQGPSIAEKLWKYLAKQGDEAINVTKRIVEKMVTVISKYVYGQVTVALLDGIVVTAAIIIMSWFFNFSTGLAFPLGLVSAIFFLIPMFGPIISCALISLLLFFTSLNIGAGISFLFFYIIYQQIENNVIAPKIQSNSLCLSPLIILISVTIGIYMFGLIGAIIAIPIAGCTKVLVEEYPNLRKLKN